MNNKHPKLRLRQAEIYVRKLQEIPARVTEHAQVFQFNGKVRIFFCQIYIFEKLTVKPQYNKPLHGKTCVQRSPLGNGKVTVIYRVTTVYQSTLQKI